MKTHRCYNRIKLDKLMRLVSEIWGRDFSIVRTQMTEDRRFRELFDFSAVVALSVWRRLQLSLQVPYSKNI